MPFLSVEVRTDYFSNGIGINFQQIVLFIIFMLPYILFCKHIHPLPFRSYVLQFFLNIIFFFLMMNIFFAATHGGSPGVF